MRARLPLAHASAQQRPNSSASCGPRSPSTPPTRGLGPLPREVLRVSNDDVLNETEAVLIAILRAAGNELVREQMQ